MKRTELVHVAVAETSVIVRSGLVAVLKRMPDLIIQPVEITSLEGLQNCMQGHQPDILIINPTFGGWFNVDEFKSNIHRHLSNAFLCCVQSQIPIC